MTKGAPRAHALLGPDPEAGRDAHDHAHRVLEHEEGKAGLCASSSSSSSCALPLVAIHLLVELTREHARGRHRVEDGEDADADHELVELVLLFGVVAAASVELEGASKARQRDKAGDEERHAERQVDDARRHEEHAQVSHTPCARLAQARERIAIERSEHERCTRLDGGHDPGERVKGARVASQRLAAPLEAGGEEPRESDEHPPDGRGRGEVVDERKGESARCRRCLCTVVGGRRRGEKKRQEVADADEEVADAHVDDGLLRKGEAAPIDGVRGRRAHRAQRAQQGPGEQPRASHRTLLLAEGVVVVVVVVVSAIVVLLLDSGDDDWIG